MSLIQTYPSPEELYNAAVDLLVRKGKEAIRLHGKFTVALSGGSTPLPVYMRLVEKNAADTLDWQKAHFFWGDERTVGPEHPESNYRAAYQTLLAPLGIPTENIHRIQGELEPKIAAQKYQEEILDWFEEQPPRFDLILLGLGSDGHTASLFPGTIHQDSDTWVEAYYVEKLNSWRISFTAHLINSAAQVLFLVKGNDKADILNRVINGPNQPDLLPSQLIQPTNGQLIWLVDSEASSNLGS
jgi:6-phosphogluconolactonase